MAVLAAALLGASLLSGGSKAVVIVAAVIAVVSWTGGEAWFARRKKGSARTRPARRGSGPFTVSYRWTGSGHPEPAGIARAIGRGLVRPEIESESPGRVVLNCGSQWKSRFWGGCFVDPKQLPLRVEIVLAPGERDADRRSIELNVNDRFGPIAVRDVPLEDRLVIAAEEIRDEVEARLKATDF